jgi:hypothetical protein
MKLLLAILLFAGISDANAQNTVVHDTDGRYWILQAHTVKVTPQGEVAGTYKVAGLGGVFAYTEDCAMGRGILSMKRLNLPNAAAVPYMDKLWSYNGSGVYDRLAIALCAEGVSK